MNLKTPTSELANEVARDWLKNYMASFAPMIRQERATSQAAAAAMVDALSGVVALTIRGWHGTKDEVVEATIKSLREAIDRDLRHLNVHPAQTSN
jgi:hypothetical protein